MRKAYWALLFLLALATGSVLLRSSAVVAATPNVPAGYEMVDLMLDPGFETSVSGFAPTSSVEGSVNQTSTSPLQGAKSLQLVVNSYGRVGSGHVYPWEGGPFADSLTAAAKLRVSSASPTDRTVKVCAIAYLQASSEPRTVCQNFSANNPQNIADVYLNLNTAGQQLYRIYFQFSMENSGSVTSVVDDAHLYVVQKTTGTPPPPACTADTWSCTSFSACSASGTQTRTCTMTFDCPNVTTPSPATSQSCTPPPPSCTADTWTCGDWAACTSSGTQTRSCTMTLDCPGAVTPSPATSQSCTPPPPSCTADTWSCTAFSACSASGTQTRTCTMTFDCPTATTPSPATSQSCTPPPTCTADTWSCGNWSACTSSGTQTRSCTMTSDCPNVTTPSPATTQSCTPPTNGGPGTNPSVSGNRSATMISPTNGETFSLPLNLRYIAQGRDTDVTINDPIEGKGRNADRVDFYIDNTFLFSENGADAEYSIFKGFANNINVTPGTHLAWARAFYSNPSMALDTRPITITVAAPTYAQTINLTQDVVLSGSQAYSLVGTSGGRIRLNGNGFKIRGSTSGGLTLKYVDLYDLGSRTDTGSPGIDVMTTGAVTIEDSIFDSLNPTHIEIDGSAPASVRRNLFRSNTRNPIGQGPFEPDTFETVRLTGSSAATKVFAGNNVAAGPIAFDLSNHWTIGGDTAADTNILIGPRTAFHVSRSSNMLIKGNYLHHLYYDDWSQGELLELFDVSPITVEHNVLQGSSWPVRGIGGEFRYNLVLHAGHQWLWPETHARVHHNLFVGGDNDAAGIIEYYDSSDIRVENNTFDAQMGSMTEAMIHWLKGSAVARSNAFLRVPDRGDATVEIDPGTTLDTDYNAFGNPQHRNYSDGRAPSHDVAGGTQQDFRLAGPLPTAPFDMDETAVWKRQLTVGTVLSSYRARYAPTSGSPLIDAGDPAGGAGNDVGAIGAGASNAFDQFGTFDHGTPASCTADNWSCGDWSACTSSGTQTRSCTMTFDCPGVVTPSPAISQSCTPPPPPPACTADTWSCTAFSACSASGTQTRTCTMTFDCPTATTPSPATSQSCTPPPPPPTCTADNWSCTAFSACSASGTQTRSCTMTLDCPGVVTPSPATSQSCTPSTPGQTTANLISDPGFETGVSDFAAQDASETVARSTTNPISGTGSLSVSINGWGNNVWWATPAVGTPFVNASKLSVSGKLRGDVVQSGTTLQFCAATYYEDGGFAQQCTDASKVKGTVSNVTAALDLDPNRAINNVDIRLTTLGSGPVTYALDDASAVVTLPGGSTTSPPPPPPPSCTADTWSCTSFSACSASGTQTRTCTMTFDCPNVTTPSPATSQSCTPGTPPPPPPPACTADTWSCSAFTACSADGVQTRSCTMTFDCPSVVTPSPATSQSCTPPPSGSSAMNPTMPQNLYAAGISPASVYLKWSAAASPDVPGQAQGRIVSYHVLRDGTQIANVTGALRYEDANLSANSTHTYAVIAVDNAGKSSSAATAVASTVPTMPVGGVSAHPVLFPAGQIAHLAAGGSDWTTQKQFCDSNLNTMIGPGYAGWDWHDAAVAYGTCYQVAKRQGDTVNAQKYAKKTLALAIVLARDHNFGTDDPSDRPIGLGDGAQKTFTLPFAPMSASQVKVMLVGTRVVPVQRAAQGSDDLNAFAPIMKVSNTPTGPADYPASAYELRYRDGLDTFRLAWTGATKPASGATYYVTLADGTVNTFASSAYTLSGTTLTMASAPAAGQAVMVSYLGANYEQTGNGLGGVNSVQPDGPGYQMRTFNPGLAAAYDALYDSGLLTGALKTEFYGILNRQVAWCSGFCYENDGRGGQVGNYFIRGLLGGTFATAYATDGENPQAAQLKAQANTLLAQMYEGIAKYIPDGYGPQGQYANGTTEDILQFLSLYRDVTGLDLMARLEWTAKVVPATIHGTKPDLKSFYDGGDWDSLPAEPLDAAMRAFVQYQPANPSAPFARKLLQELGESAPGTVTDYRASYPLSYFGQVASPMYSRSDWGSNAVWTSLVANDSGAVAHQHADAGHVSINRGADYLLDDAGGYGFGDSVYHNTLLFDDRGIAGYTPEIVYPLSQGSWGPETQLIKRADGGDYTYGQADFADAYMNNDGVSNSVKTALRSVVLLRPDVVVMFDQVQVANSAIKRVFNLNFGGPLTGQGSARSATVVNSKLFMQTVSSPGGTPIVSPLTGANGQTSSNYQETASGNLKDVFIHVFQAMDKDATPTVAGKLMRSVDRNLQGAEVMANGKLWTTLFAAYDRSFGGSVQYVLPSAGAHRHLLNDLVPSSAYVVSVTDTQGHVIRTLNRATDQNGTLTFDSASGESTFYVTPGSSAPASVPVIVGNPNA